MMSHFIPERDANYAAAQQAAIAAYMDAILRRVGTPVEQDDELFVLFKQLIAVNGMDGCIHTPQYQNAGAEVQRQLNDFINRVGSIYFAMVRQQAAESEQAVRDQEGRDQEVRMAAAEQRVQRAAEERRAAERVAVEAAEAERVAAEAVEAERVAAAERRRVLEAYAEEMRRYETRRLTALIFVLNCVAVYFSCGLLARYTSMSKYIVMGEVRVHARAVSNVKRDLIFSNRDKLPPRSAISWLYDRRAMTYNEDCTVWPYQCEKREQQACFVTRGVPIVGCIPDSAPRASCEEDEKFAKKIPRAWQLWVFGPGYCMSVLVDAIVLCMLPCWFVSVFVGMSIFFRDLSMLDDMYIGL